MTRVVQRALSGIAITMNVLAGAMLLYLILSAAVDVVVRALTGRGIPGSIEYGEVALVMLAFLSLARTQQKDGHVTVDLLTSRLPRRTAAGLELVGMSVALVFLIWMTWASYEQAVVSVARGEYRFGTVSAPVWPARVAIAASLAALVGVIAVHLVRLFLELRGRSGRAADLEPPPLHADEKAL
ncbi:MAG: TRAP transporter small permease [Mycobacteriales bacterium]